MLQLVWTLLLLLLNDFLLHQNKAAGLQSVGERAEERERERERERDVGPRNLDVDVSSFSCERWSSNILFFFFYFLCAAVDGEERNGRRSCFLWRLLMEDRKGSCRQENR